MSKLFASIAGVTHPFNIQVTSSHNAATATANIQCERTTKDVGDAIEIDLGYVGNHSKVFKGYVKQVEHQVPEDTWSITCMDVMIRAIDYFIAAADPANPYKINNITAEELVKRLLAMCGLPLDHKDNTHFSFAVAAESEINLVTVYDQCRTIADLLTWSIYADEDGETYFVNRKPWIMSTNPAYPGHDQVGMKNDSAAWSVSDLLGEVLQSSLVTSERDLRNKVVIYGANQSHGEDSDGQSWNPLLHVNQTVLPAGYYKTAVGASPLIDPKDCDEIATYNLALYNRLGINVQAQWIGDPKYIARKCVSYTDSYNSITNELFYVYMVEHNWSNAGYTCNVELKK
jgi:hypothetical protein